jgi:hypothetical protein
MGIADITQSGTTISWRSSRRDISGGTATLTGWSGLSKYQVYPSNNASDRSRAIILDAEL